MLKSEYNNNRPRIECPNCGKFITKANFNRHYNACIDPNSKYNQKKLNSHYAVDNDDLCCKFCNKELKSLNALAQHELRCSQNPNRTDFQNLTNYIANCRKGKTADNCEAVAKQKLTMADKYKNGYVSPLKGSKRIFDYVYKEHNDSEIQKWLNYIGSLDVTLSKYTTLYHSNSYNMIARRNRSDDIPKHLIFEHDYIAYVLLDGKLQKRNTVHHIDKNFSNNSITNLLVFDTGGDHKRFHTSSYAYLNYDDTTHLFTCKILK